MSELPRGWVNTEFNAVISSMTNGINGKQNKEGNGIPVSRIETISYQVIDFNKVGYLSDYDKKKIEQYKLSTNDILFSHINSPIHLGKTAIYNSEKVLYHGVNLLRIRLNEAVEPRFFNYYCKYIRALGVFSSQAQHAVNQSSLNQKKLGKFEIVLPPKNEQVRIADKLDSILAKVGRAQARLEKIPGILKRFRQSVLAAATSGELTKEWREENGVSFSSWEDTIFSNLSREITVGFVGKMSDKYQDSGIKFLRSQNVRAFKFDPKNLLFISPEFHREIYKSRLEAGDLAVVRSGAPGTTCVIPSDLGEANCSDLVIVRPNEKLVPDFGCIFMNSSVAQKNVKENQVGVAQQHFNVGSMKLMPIQLPPKTEQIEIVRRVHDLFSLAEVVEKNYSDSIKRVKKLTQSILAKAFRGELVEQVSSDEPAEALLNNIQKTRESKSLSSSKALAFSIKNSLREKITVERKDVMSLANAPDDYLLDLLRQLGGEASAEILWSKSRLNIDHFYAKLKQEVQRGYITEDSSSPDPSLRKLKSAVK